MVIQNGKSENSRKMSKMLISSVAALLLTFALTASPAQSKNDDYIMDTDSIGQSEGIINSDQILELGVPTSNSLKLEGEQSLRFGNLDRAIMVLQRSVEMAPGDVDGRILYAEALEKKLMRQREKDPKLFNFLVKQWLFVAKSSEFADQAMQGYQHLGNLTGKQPKRFEKPNKFLARVMIPEDGTQKVHIGNSGVTNSVAGSNSVTK